MKKSEQDIIIFPGWKKQLERDGLDALKEKRYEDALEHFEKLELYEASTFEMLTGKVICLIELGRYDDAISVCRKLMKEDVDNYYKYLHIYVTILFQTSQYGEIVSLLDEIFENEEIPHTYRQQFWQIYDLSKKFHDDQAESEYDDAIVTFIQRLDNGSFQEQWRLLSSIRKNTIHPYVNDLVPYLIDSKLNPVIKTGILQCFIEQQVDQNMQVHKFDQSAIFNPKELKDVMDTQFAKQILLKLSYVEDQDPTLFEFIRQILFRFLYIYFPFIPDEEQITDISEAVLSLALDYLQIDGEYQQMLEEPNEQRDNWKKKIQSLEMKYFSQIES
ncbi:tetratricopeptide repeat protein [Salirhabdus sp. Marseille-P4669]|uniref:tetratricopeptide repeat protein n=1 Tax=Salirhabdus sp. Marseille-P4669 TaxID=2042310 RepID=UPI000C79D2ED|nr:tetratricopeptide repeat protein [Salirhabdus sp. Marseille-P4669]